MNRIECFKVMAELVGDALVVTGAGGNTVEWYACRPGDGNFRVRTMGLVSSIALGMALGLPHRQVVAIDGDGSLLMNLCSLPTIARKNPPNLTHVVLDNEVYEASGEIDTATGAGTDLVAMARGAGIRRASWAASPDESARRSSPRRWKAGTRPSSGSRWRRPGARCLRIPWTRWRTSTASSATWRRPKG